MLFYITCLNLVFSWSFNVFFLIFDALTTSRITFLLQTCRKNQGFFEFWIKLVLALFFQGFLMQNDSKNDPKMHWLSFQAHPTAIKITKSHPKRPQEEQKFDQSDPKWSKRAPKATPSEPKSRQNPTFAPQDCRGDLLAWFFTALGSNLLDLFMFFQIIIIFVFSSDTTILWLGHDFRAAYPRHEIVASAHVVLTET